MHTWSIRLTWQLGSSSDVNEVSRSKDRILDGDLLVNRLRAEPRKHSAPCSSGSVVGSCGKIRTRSIRSVLRRFKRSKDRSHRTGSLLCHLLFPQG
jgi:hypothetical protein